MDLKNKENLMGARIEVKLLLIIIIKFNLNYIIL